MSAYAWVRLIHVVAAIVWVGAGVTVVAFTIRAARAGHALMLARDMAVVGPRLGGPASLALLASGAWMVWTHPALSFTQPWIVLALSVFAISLGIGVLFHRRNFQHLDDLARKHGERSPAVEARLRLTFLVTRIEVGLLMIGLLDMILRPSF